MKLTDLYQQAYAKLEHCTPLRYDCGRLCNRACCRGPEETAGMWLFPGEEELLAGESGFQIMPLARQPETDRPLFWLICAGTCNRAKRPLSCRIFPLTPLVTKKGFVVTEIDPRARPFCPLANEQSRMQPEFGRAVSRICRQLAAEPDIQEFFRLLTGEIEEYRQISQLFGR